MEFNLPRRKQKDMGIEMGPLMDIVFILLIFFVVTSSFTRETGVDVTKPQAQTASQLEKENLLLQKSLSLKLAGMSTAQVRAHSTI